MQTKKEKRKNAEVLITGTLPKDRVAEESEKTLVRIQKDIVLPGFRKGKVPLEKVRAEVGEKALWKEAAEDALKRQLEDIFKEHGVMPIMPVSASLKASDMDGDVPFEIVAVIAPSCSLENYKALALEAVQKVPKTDEPKERERAIQALRAQARAMVKSAEQGDLTDDEAKKLGFENGAAVEHFLVGEAERAVHERELQKKRAAIADTLIEKGSCDIPRVIILEEARALLEAMKKDVTRRRTSWNDYVKKINKTEEAVLQELETPAEKRIALDLLFANIARAEKVEVAASDQGRITEALLAQGVEKEAAGRYVHAVVLREKVWEILGAPSLERDIA